MADQNPTPPTPNPSNPGGGNSNQGQQPPQGAPQNQQVPPPASPLPPFPHPGAGMPLGAGGAQLPGAQGIPTPPPPPKPPIPKDPNARVGQLKTRGKHVFKIPPHPNTTFDEEYFLILLEGSISLTMEEKQRVIDAIPHLRIEQINELISIFEEEKQKFSELESEFADDVHRLKQEREREIETVETKKEEATEEASAAEKAAALRKDLGL